MWKAIRIPLFAIAGVLFLLALSTSCNSGGGTDLDSLSVGDSVIINQDTTGRFEVDEWRRITQERFSSKDTIPVSHKRFVKFLPDSVSGFPYTLDDGNTFRTKSISYSEASRAYFMDDSRDDFFEVIISDHSADSNMMRTLVQLFNAADGVDFEGEWDQRVILGDTTQLAWISYSSETRIAAATAIVDLRYMVKVEASEQKDANKVLEVLKSIPLDDLTGL